MTAVAAHAQDVDMLIQKTDSLAEYPEMSLEILNKAVFANSQSEELLKVRAETYEHLKQYGKAAEDYQKITLLSPDDEHVWYLLGKNQYEDGQYEEALQSVNRSVEINAQYIPAYHLKINILLQTNKPNEALKVSNATLRVGETAMNYFLQGKVNDRLNARQQAEWAYSKAVKLDKGFIEAYIALSNLAAVLNKAEETLVNAEAALAINPDSEEALIARSRGWALQEQYGDAIEDVSYVIKLNPQNAQAYCWRGTYYHETNKNKEALQDFENALKIDPENRQALAGRADTYAAMGNKQAALDDYRKLQATVAEYPEKEAVLQLAGRKIFELNRENRAPQLMLENTNDFYLKVPDNKDHITIKGKVTDESPIGKLLVNRHEIPLIPIGDGFEFTADVPLDGLDDIEIEVADVYDNSSKASYHVVRNETSKPQIALFTPKADESGTMTIAAGDLSILYIEGKITDESNIVSIEIEGKAVDFDHEDTNPTFSAVLDVSLKSRFTITVIDQYGNSTEQIYPIEKITDSTVSVPMQTQQPIQSKPVEQQASN
jgi:tetratricopeptide (TPR) repeat protein